MSSPKYQLMDPFEETDYEKKDFEDGQINKPDNPSSTVGTFSSLV
jgi:hypothetical protein